MSTLKTTLRNYGKNKLIESICPADPLEFFSTWLEEALKHETYEPNAMTLATVDSEGRPCARIVLLKEINPAGFIFFTNYHSAKSRELAINQNVALVFWWPTSERQVRVQGVVEKTSEQISAEYFQSRSKESKIGAIISDQSEVIANREILDQRFLELQQTYKDTNDIPKPAHWGGYLVKPHKIEFWQGGQHRLHDRICYEKIHGEWQRYRLAP